MDMYNTLSKYMYNEADTGVYVLQQTGRRRRSEYDDGVIQECPVPSPSP